MNCVLCVVFGGKGRGDKAHSELHLGLTFFGALGVRGCFSGFCFLGCCVLCAVCCVLARGGQGPQRVAGALEVRCVCAKVTCGGGGSATGLSNIAHFLSSPLTPTQVAALGGAGLAGARVASSDVQARGAVWPHAAGAGARAAAGGRLPVRWAGLAFRVSMCSGSCVRSTLLKGRGGNGYLSGVFRIAVLASWRFADACCALWEQRGGGGWSQGVRRCWRMAASQVCVSTTHCNLAV